MISHILQQKWLTDRLWGRQDVSRARRFIAGIAFVRFIWVAGSRGKVAEFPILLEDFGPQLVFVSAGFDAHHEDPLAYLKLRDEDYRWVTDRLMDVADRHAQGRVVSTLEGGYNVTALGRCVVEHVKGLLRL